MAENIKLKQVMINRMVFKMGRDRKLVFIICRELNRRKLVYFISVRKNNDSAGMLSRASFYIFAAFCKSLHFAFSKLLMMSFHVTFNVTVGCLFRACGYGSRTECMPFSEKHLCIIMRFRLIFSGKIKVYIRFFIALKSHKGFKRYIKSVFYQRLAANRA